MSLVPDAVPAPPQRAPRPPAQTGLSYPMAAGVATLTLIVGCLTGGALARPEKDVQLVTPASCHSAMKSAHELLMAYGDGLRAAQAPPAQRAEGLRASADKVAERNPVWAADKKACEEAR